MGTASDFRLTSLANLSGDLASTVDPNPILINDRSESGRHLCHLRPRIAVDLESLDSCKPRPASAPTRCTAGPIKCASTAFASAYVSTSRNCFPSPLENHSYPSVPGSALLTCGHRLRNALEFFLLLLAYRKVHRQPNHLLHHFRFPFPAVSIGILRRYHTRPVIRNQRRIKDAARASRPGARTLRQSPDSSKPR